MAYLQPMSASQQSLPPNVSDSLERDQRKKAVDKFLARAEIAMVSVSSDLDASMHRRIPRVVMYPSVNCGMLVVPRRLSAGRCP